MRLLLVEDERRLAGLIARGLSARGYAVDVAYDGEEALAQFTANDYDLVILDLNLPKIDGLDVLREIRAASLDARVLILSARSSVEERVTGLDEGANDYLVKPFDFRELEARVRGLLRQDFVQRPAILCCAGLELDTNARIVAFGSVEIPLARKEYGILEYLMANEGRLVSAEEIMEHVWNNELDPFSNTIRYHLHSLRKKLREASGADLIETVRGQGYRMGGDER